MGLLSSAHYVAVISTLVVIYTVSASEAATCSVKNPPSKKSYTTIQSAINAVKSFGPTTLYVTGSCSESFAVPFADNITLRGQGGNQAASISPPAVQGPAASIFGSLTIDNMTVQSSGANVGALLVAYDGGRVEIKRSKVTSSVARVLIAAENGSHLSIVNSSIRMTSPSSEVAVSISGGSSLAIHGSSSEDSGPNIHSTVVSAGSSAVGIECSIGGSVILGADGSGSVQIENNNKSIDANGCSIGLFNNSGSGTGISLSGNVTDGMALWNSNARLRNVTISGNGRMGLNLWTSNVYLYGTSFQSNGNSDIFSGLRSTAALDGPEPDKQNSFLSLSPSSFSCYHDGKIYYQSQSVAQDLASYAANAPTCLESYE